MAAFPPNILSMRRATALVPTSCEDEAVSVLRALRSKANEYREDGREGYFNAEQNALVARNAELYYRTMVRGGPGSWNVRDRHMVETLDRVMEHHGRDAILANRPNAYTSVQSCTLSPTHERTAPP